MKKFYLCKLCLIVFGALLTVQSVTAGNWSSKGFSVKNDTKIKTDSFEKSLSRGTHGINVVEDGISRQGPRSIKFELRHGDCSRNSGWSDCANDRMRHELSGEKKADGVYFYKWSLFVPESFKTIYPAKLALGQFHQHKGHVVWMFQSDTRGIYMDNQTLGKTIQKTRLVENDELTGKWTDFFVHANWTDKDSGFLKVFINGQLKYSWDGATKTKGKKVYQKFGAYASFVSRYTNMPSHKELPTIVVYYDEIGVGRKCEDVEPGYDICTRL